MANKILFYFDVVCPYAYLASTRIERLARDAGAELTWKPMLLGGVFQAIGGQAAIIPQKVAASRLDPVRWADYYGVPFSYHPSHPRRSVDAMRLCCAAAIAGDPAPVAHDLYRAYWVENRDIADKAVLSEVAARHGLAADAFAGDAAKAMLRAVTDEAVAAGAFGAPTFIVEAGGKRHLFWGQDRMLFVEKALNGWEVPA
jgi:2-hydroxychromene-2-carboxylate isomerase